MTQSKVGGQLDADLAEIDVAELANVAVAYEPIWAIGTGVTATPDQAQETVAFCRARIRERFGDAADGVRILYGGSVKPDNIDTLMAAAGHRRRAGRRREPRPAGLQPHRQVHGAFVTHPGRARRRTGRSSSSCWTAGASPRPARTTP